MTPRRATQTRETYVTTASARETTDSRATTAIIAWHGMGQQLPFATLADVAEALARCHARLTTRAMPAVVTREVDLGGERLRRAELSLPGDGGSTREVHVYEAYWAPLTEGKITLAETVKFLVGAGIQGIRYGIWPPRVLERFLFDRLVTFPLSPMLALVYLLLVVTLAALVVVNAVVVGALVLKLVTDPGNPARWPSYVLLRDVTLDLAVLALPFVGLGVGLFTTYRAATKAGHRGLPLKKRSVVAALLWFLIALTVVVTLAVSGLITYHVIADRVFERPGWPWAAVPAMSVHPAVALLAAIAVWSIVVGGSALVRWFLLEFVGDTAVYVSSHVLNRFFETRQAVKARSCTVASAIYSHGQYNTVILMGHSLGSVIAYDTLNRLIVEDQTQGGRVGVAQRTRLLITFGSVLDKTAFLFRVQTDHSDIREAMASATQPLISDPAARPEWINIFSRQDVFSGALDYYDPANVTRGSGPSLPAPPMPITNMEDVDAWIPILAHVQYWTNPLLVETLYKAIP